jgi:5-formyltetrahydrofolate cyclo-ligase
VNFANVDAKKGGSEMEHGAPKDVFRKHALRRRNALHHGFAHGKGENWAGMQLARHLEQADILPVAGVIVAGYLPLGSEISPEPLMALLHDRGCSLALPVVVGRHQPMVFRLWQVGIAAEYPLERGAHGTRHPAPGAPEVQPDIILVPMVACDLHGRRMGYGGGYYDRTLPRFPQARCIGLAYEGQVYDEIPHDPHDSALACIATEARVRHYVPQSKIADLCDGG